jgi:hypothetical protein
MTKKLDNFGEFDYFAPMFKFTEIYSVNSPQEIPTDTDRDSLAALPVRDPPAFPGLNMALNFSGNFFSAHFIFAVSAK